MNIAEIKKVKVKCTCGAFIQKYYSTSTRHIKSNLHKGIRRRSVYNVVKKYKPKKKITSERIVKRKKIVKHKRNTLNDDMFNNGIIYFY